MATTSRGIVYPTTGNAVTPLATRFADLATSTDTAIGAVDTKFSNDNRQFYGPAASIGSVTGMKLGDSYQESDSNKILWKYDGSNWVTGENGMYLIRPTSVTNGSVASNGHVVPSAGVDNFTLAGVFSSKYKRYRLVAGLVSAGGVNRDLLTLASAGVPNTSATYYTQALYQAGSTVAGFYQSGYNFITSSAVDGNSRVLDLMFDRVAEAIDTNIVGTSYVPTGGLTTISSYHQPLVSYDGFRLMLGSTGGGKTYSTGTTDVAVYGLA